MNLKTTSGPVLEKAADLVGILTNQREGDIVFIDEIHRLRPIIEEFLYPAMEDYRVEIRLSDGPKAQTMTMNIERFTLVGATTRFGLLTAPMRARFGIVQRLNFYPADELAVIVQQKCGQSRRRDNPEWSRGDGSASPGNSSGCQPPPSPSTGLRAGRADGIINRKVAQDALALLDVDEAGLDEMDGRILKTIIEKFEGGPVGLSSLAVALEEDASTLEEVPEPFLIQEGFLIEDPQGAGTRQILPALWVHAAPGPTASPNPPFEE